MKKIVTLLTIIVIFSCKDEKVATQKTPSEPEIVYEYGYRLNDYKVINDTIKSGENFSEILDRNHVEYPKVLEIEIGRASCRERV